MSPEELIAERKNQHGDWNEQSHCARMLKRIIHEFDQGMNDSQREALDMIAVKMSRILCGDAVYADHWQDIAGYARLGERGHE